MAIELFRRVSSLTTLRGRVAMFNARKNRLVRRGFKLEAKMDIRWNIIAEVQNVLDLRWDIEN